MEYNFEKLEVYHLAEEFVLRVYRLAKELPQDELFGLTSQVKRAATSVLLNIAEGATGRSKKDFVRFLVTAVGSLVETKAALGLAAKLGFLDQKHLDAMSSDIDRLFFKLNALKKSLNE